MDTSLSPSWLRALVLQSGFLDAYAKAEPYSPEFLKKISGYLDEAGRELWSQLKRGFHSPSDELTLRNAWALAAADPLLGSAVWRSAVPLAERGELPSRDLEKLRTSLLEAKDWRGWLRPIIDRACEASPQIANAEEFTPTLRLRYALAEVTRERLDAVACVDCLREEKRCSRFARQRELSGALRAAKRRSLPIGMMSKQQFFALPVMERLVISTDDFLLQELIDVGAAERATLKTSVDNDSAARRTIRAQLAALIRSSSPYSRTNRNPREGLRLEDKHITAFNKGSERIELGAIDADLRKEFGRRLKTWISTPRSSDGIWIPLSGHAISLIRSICPGTRLPRYLGLAAPDITYRLIDGTLSPKGFRADDLKLLQKSWSDHDRTLLARCGLINVLDKLELAVASTVFPDVVQEADAHGSVVAKQSLSELVKRELCLTEAIQLLAENKCVSLRGALKDAIESGSEKWIEVCHPHFGTDLVKGIYSEPSYRTANALLAFLARESEIKDLGRYRAQLAQSIGLGLTKLRKAGKRSAIGSDAARDLKDFERWVKLGQAYVKSFDGANQLLATALGTKEVLELLKGLGTKHQLSEHLERTLSNENEIDKLYRYRLAHADSGPDLLYILQARPALVVALRPNAAEKLKPDNSVAGTAARVLCFRREPKRLKNLAEVSGELRLRKSVALACSLLQETARDRGYLELTVLLGTRNIRRLAAVLAAMDRDAATGNKLHALYHQYELPKKSGGTRTVSTPDALLKKVQRAILACIVDPLGAHPAAHGFVKGRSIVSNAALHVGSPVVSNCDIARCFPSVRWSLVLGALRRDLGDTLSPAAVSLLVDICTLEGGLPIGAPTSPALLNRVLLKTDELLSAAAEKRGCRYSRYADDLTFSGDHRAVELLGVARRTLAQIGLELDTKKTNIYRRGRRQIVTGLVVNDRVSIPRRLRRRMRAAVHAVEQGKAPTWHGQDEAITSLKGRVAYLRSVNRAEGEKLLRRLQNSGEAGGD